MVQPAVEEQLRMRPLPRSSSGNSTAFTRAVPIRLMSMLRCRMGRGSPSTRLAKEEMPAKLAIASSRSVCCKMISLAASTLCWLVTSVRTGMTPGSCPSRSSMASLVPAANTCQPRWLSACTHTCPRPPVAPVKKTLFISLAPTELLLLMISPECTRGTPVCP